MSTLERSPRCRGRRNAERRLRLDSPRASFRRASHRRARPGARALREADPSRRSRGRAAARLDLRLETARGARCGARRPSRGNRALLRGARHLPREALRVPRGPRGFRESAQSRGRRGAHDGPRAGGCRTRGPAPRMGRPRLERARNFLLRPPRRPPPARVDQILARGRASRKARSIRLVSASRQSESVHRFIGSSDDR